MLEDADDNDGDEDLDHPTPPIIGAHGSNLYAEPFTQPHPIPPLT